MPVVKNLMVRSGADFSAMYREMNNAQKKLAGFQRGIKKLMTGIGLALGGLAVGKLVKDSVQSAMGVESSMAQLGRTMGDNAGLLDNWARTQAKAFGMAREEAYKYGAVYSNLISTFAKGAEETTRYTTELMKASAVVASGTGRSMQDTMERIRSGLLGNTEAIEDLGIHVNVAMLESTEAFHQFAKGRSWHQLAFQEQQQIRLMAILEQANTKYGDSLVGTTATRQMMFLATLKNIRLNLGQAFLPISSTVLPILTALAGKLEYVTSVLAQFMQALFGKKQAQAAKATQAQASAVADLGDATEEAGKQAKGALAGFDEINQLSQSEAGGGVAVSPVEGLLPDSMEESGGAIDAVVTGVEVMAEKVRAAFTAMKDAVVESKNIIVPAIGAIGGALAGLAAFQVVTGLVGQFARLKAAVGAAWKTIAANPAMLLVVAIGALIGVLVAAYKTNEHFRATVDGLWAQIKTALTPVVMALGQALSWLWQNAILPLGRITADVLVVAINALVAVGQWLWMYVLEPLGRFIVERLGPAFLEIARIVGQLFKKDIEGLIKVLEFLWHDVLKPIALWLGDTFQPVFETVGESIKETIQGLQTTFDGLIKFITGVFTGDWKKAWDGVKQIFKGVFDSLWGIVKVPLNRIIEGINWVIGGLNKIHFELPSWVPFVGGKSFGINIPKIPRLATGGITNGPMLAMIGDNPGGREVVSPLDDLTDIIASAVGTAVLQAMQVGGGQGDQGRSIVLNLDGVQVARGIIPALDRERSRAGGLQAVIKPV